MHDNSTLNRYSSWHSGTWVALLSSVLACLAFFASGGTARAACPSSPGGNQVIVYQHANREGRCAVLDIGTYAWTPFGSGSNTVDNDSISSITLGSGVSADLFQHSGLSGVLYHYENGPFTFNLGGWANDDVSSIRVYSRTPYVPLDTIRLFNYSASGTDSASNNQTKTFDLGTLKAGTTVRVGTCSAGGDLPSATATGDTYLRVLFNGGIEMVYDDDGCTTSRASYLTYTLPYTGNVSIKAGCYSTLSCSGTVVAAYNHPDSNGSISNVTSSFNAMVGNAPQRNKLNFNQNSTQNGLMIPYDYDIMHEKHFQGLQRIPRTLDSTSDSSPRFVLSGSDNADLFTVNFSPPSLPPSGLVGPLPETPAPETKALGVESNGGRYYDSNGRMHLGALQACGRWLAGGIEQQGGPGPSILRFWDISRLPNPLLVREIDNTQGSSSGIAITKKPGKNQGYLMFVAGLKPQQDPNCRPVPPYITCPTYNAAQVWTLSGVVDNSYRYANLATGTWALSQRTVRLPHEFQSINFVNQDDGDLYLVGTAGFGTTHPEEGTDTAVLMRVDGNEASGFSVTEVASKVFTCHFDSSRQCAFNAGAGIFVDADLSALRLYASKAWRPDNTNAPMTFVEYY